jgi:hypothetical protein
VSRSPNWGRKLLRGAIWLAPVVTALMVLSWVPSAASPAVASGPGTLASAIASPAVAGTPASVLQALINAAPPGSTVHLPAGTYVGQLRVDKSLDLVGAGEGKTILQSSSTMSPDMLGNVFVIEITTHATVHIEELTVRVTEQCMLSNSIGVATGGGIGVGGNSTLDVTDISAQTHGPSPKLNAVCNTTTGEPGMYSFGRAISIGFDDGPTDGSMHQVEGHGSVTDVSTAGFDIFSISVGGVRGPTGSTATITDNTVLVGPGPYTAAYGIVVYGVSTVDDNVVTGEAGSDGGIAVVDTSATVADNLVQDFSCYSAPFPISPPCGVDPLYDDQDLGIFLADIAPGTVVEYNTVTSVDSGILVEGPGAPATISHNTIKSSTFYALELIDANQTFRNDVITGGEYAIAVGAAASNTEGVLWHDSISGYSVSVGLLESNYPWVAKLVVIPK